MNNYVSTSGRLESKKNENMASTTDEAKTEVINKNIIFNFDRNNLLIPAK
jgi:hypothetical protein